MISLPISQKSLLFIFLIFIGLFGFIFMNRFSQKQASAVVAITQIVEHSSLDQEREGILKALADAGYIQGKNLRVIQENAQGSITMATQIAAKLLSVKPDVIVAISTPSAQALVQGCEKHRIPLVFTAVTDPVSARLAVDSASQLTMTAGVTDFLPAKITIEFLRQVLPEITRVGIIYNSGETNSLRLVEDFQKQAVTAGLHVFTATANNTSDVAAATLCLIGHQAEVIFVPNDNTAVSAIDSIVRVATQGVALPNGQHKIIPVFAGDVGSVQRGAVAAIGYNRKDLGYKAGQMVVKILKGTPPEQLGIIQNHKVIIMINKKAAEKMGVNIPPEITVNAHFVDDGETGEK